MSSGREFLVPPENDAETRAPWVPITPGKLILPTRSNGIPVERRGNHQPERANLREDSREVVGVANRNLQQMMNYKVVGQNFDPIRLMGQMGSSYNSGVPLAEKPSFNHNVAFHSCAFVDDNAAQNNNTLAEQLMIKNTRLMAATTPANGMLNRSLDAAHNPTILNSYSQIDSSWTEPSFTSLLLGSEYPSSGSNQWISNATFLQMPRVKNCFLQMDFPARFRPNYNLNSPPRSEVDATLSTTNSLPFAPETPDQRKQFKDHNNSEMLNFSVDISSSHEKDKLENLLISVEKEANENGCNELVQNIVDSSSAAISTRVKEKNTSEQQVDRGIDLNKTPEQKLPKRRKHRPKVIVEGKPKRTPKPKTSRNTKSKENSSGKRKYERKKSLEAKETQPTDTTNEFTVPASESGSKSCKRMLNFDSENNTKGENQGNNPQMEIPRETKAAFMSLDSQSTKLCTECKSVTGAEFAMQMKEQNGNIAKFHQSGNASNLACSINQMPAESIPLPNRGASAAMPAAIKYNTLNVIARSVNVRNFTQYQKSETTGNRLGHQHQGELNGNFCQANSNYQNLKQTRHMNWLSTPPLSEGNVVNSDERRGLKREYCRTIEHASPSSENWMGTPSLFQETYQVDDHSSNGCIVGNRSLETHKKRRTANGFHSEIFSTPCVTFAKDVSRQVATVGGNILKPDSAASQISARNYNADKTSKKPKDAVNGARSNYHSHSITDEHNLQLTASDLLSNKEITEKKRSSRSTQIHDICLSTTMSQSNLLSSTSPMAPTSGYEQIVGTFHANMSVKRYMEPTSSNTVSSNTNKVLLQEHKDARHEDQQYTIQARDLPKKQENTDTLDVITCRLQGLHITGKSKQEEEKNALVPYEVDDTLVPYEGFHLIKKHARPKVDLDPETNRIWKLIMGKEASDGIEEEDNGKEKWWEEERDVFKGRADSFIARMHLVQGDRRFSQWKGSVVDSVIGVFLTQNVSDHLSSSAFMSLAARFPLQSTTTDLTCYQSGRTSRIAKEPEIQRLDPDRTVKSYENPERQLVYNQASVTYCESPVYRTGPISGTRTRLATEYNGMAKEKGSSSQNSSRSLFLQVNGKIQSSSRSNYYSTHGGEPSKIHGPSTTLLHMGRTSSFQGLHCPVTGISCSENRSTHWHKQLEDINYNNQMSSLKKFSNLISSSTLYKPTISSIPYMQGSIMGPSHFQSLVTPDLAVQEVDTFGPLREQSIFFLPSTASGNTNEKGVDYKRRSIGHGAERISKTQHRVSIIQAPKIGQSEYLVRHPTHQESSLQSEPQATQNQLYHKTHQQEMSRTFHMESLLVREPGRATDTVAARKSDIAHQVPTEPKCTRQAFDIEERITAGGKKILLENKTTETNGKEQVYFPTDTNTGTSANTSNAKNGKAEDDKKQSFDWDSLRKQVQDSGRRRKRTKDTVDSLDYEAVWRADVNEISSAIKERGMNNVLAGRIKDFLNRLLREHGSIDLEWLRDIPPDKAKDYLLSIRGLGLKSVECVRLLTLHHLAFPVDTNVGRIAVRLGWVPLQPLPESLQLHLLELYPILESIQKYLWPRLYKLDRQTLYELHYQMITFGKVFCTKSKPNCNACPMRGECRHFASAFASARLALPAPEEKNIVRSTKANDKSSAVVIKPMPLPLAGSDELIGTVSIKGYEPIIEEPTTPELDTTELSESDIEDGIYEDSDEIPVIKLNIEEFTQNLHSYMQENTELQESDMSNALVALNTEAASLPTPKLKNVSRLRTEHQVYELPDSHPLLEGMDKREPDDPSPYLLALWTPGETANSVQPPVRGCVSQEESGKLCNEKTCFSCSSVREANSLTVRGTLLIPCRTAMRGSFPLNGTYFQVNEVFADHESSLNPINVPRALIWNLPRRMVYFGTSVSTIFKGLSTEGIQYCFWRGFVCVRGFDQKTRAPRPLMARLHFPASKLTKTKVEEKQRGP